MFNRKENKDMSKKVQHISTINSYTFGCNCKEKRVIEICGLVNEALLLIHPTSKIEIVYEKSSRQIKMLMTHTTNFAYEAPTQYKNAMKLFDLAISSILNGKSCHVIEGAITPHYSN